MKLDDLYKKIKKDYPSGEFTDWQLAGNLGISGGLCGMWLKKLTDKGLLVQTEIKTILGAKKFTITKPNAMKRHQTNIDYYMGEAGITTVSQLAKQMDMEVETLRSRLRGNISMDTLERLAEFFDVTVKDLLK